jgi:hypothetical protein
MHRTRRQPPAHSKSIISTTHWYLAGTSTSSRTHPGACPPSPLPFKAPSSATPNTTLLQNRTYSPEKSHICSFPALIPARLRFAAHSNCDELRITKIIYMCKLPGRPCPCPIDSSREMEARARAAVIVCVRISCSPRWKGKKTTPHQRPTQEGLRPCGKRSY